MTVAVQMALENHAHLHTWQKRRQQRLDPLPNSCLVLCIILASSLLKKNNQSIWFRAENMGTIQLFEKNKFFPEIALKELFVDREYDTHFL